jgi:hypothetical protein
MTTKPINQRYNQTVILDASGNGSVEITMRADFVLQRTRWLVQGGTGTNQAMAENYIDSQPFEGTYSGNNDQSNSSRLLTPQNTVTCEWTAGPPGGTASLFLWGIEYPAGEGIPPPSSNQGPGNPVFGGGVLIRDAIQSSDYVPGVAGWQLSRDGNADLNNVRVRGTIDVESSDGSAVIIAPDSGGRIDFVPNTEPGVTNPNNGQIYSSNTSDGTGSYAFMTFNSPRITDAHGSQGPVSVEILTATTDGSAFPGVDSANALFEVSADIQCHGDLLVNTNAEIDGNLSVNDVDIGAGLVMQDGIVVATGAGSTVDSVLWTTKSATYRANRAFRVRIEGFYTPNSAGNFHPRIRKTNLAGQVLKDGGFFTNVLSQPTDCQFSGIFITGGSPVTAALAVTGILSAGTCTLFGAAATTGATTTIEVRDIGAAADYTNATATVPTLV